MRLFEWNATPRRARVTGRRAATVIALAGLALVAMLAAATAAGDDGPVSRTLRRVLTSPEATAPVVLERSDPFGGPPERERGRVWYIPGRGLRYQVNGSQGLQLAIDRTADR
ncbi:MAG TPA: hypothetical protein VFU59_07180, partial [Candidatus Eisenbacteria bacterium]|nr:hypothetical protein [Candidatus Eisenbacteria bacterium]